MSIAAMKQALEALQGLLVFNPTHGELAAGREAVTALREAIAQAEKDKKAIDERVSRWREEKKLWDAKIEQDRPCWHRLDELRSKHDAVVEALEVVLDDLMYKDHARVIDVARAALNAAREEKT